MHASPAVQDVESPSSSKTRSLEKTDNVQKIEGALDLSSELNQGEMNNVARMRMICDGSLFKLLWISGVEKDLTSHESPPYR